MRLALAAVCFWLLALTGCSFTRTAAPGRVTGAAIRGNVHGGQQPIVGAHVYLFSAGLTGYGGSGIAASSANASLSLLNPDKTGHSDSVGAYVLTGSDGGFTITGDYICTPGTQVYALALGGDPGAGTNSAVGLMAVLGNCPDSTNFLTATPFIWINEVSTVAAAYAFAGFATDPTHVSSSGSSLAKIGIANAFATAANLASLSTGAALATTPNGNGMAPQATVNSVADVLAACINSTGSTSPACSTLFANSLSDGTSGSTPGDTASAVINIAHHPGANVAALSALFATIVATAPFQPTLTSQPNDLTVAIQFQNAPLGEFAIDGSGNVWGTFGLNSVVKMSPAGDYLSGKTGYTGGGLNGPSVLAVDTLSNVWVANETGNSITELSASGAFLSGASGYTGGGIGRPIALTFDGSGNVWIVNNYNNSLSELSSTGAVLSPAPSTFNTFGGFHFATVPLPLAITTDGTGNLWVVNGGTGNSSDPGSLLKFSPYGLQPDPSGTISAGTSTYTGGGLNFPNGLAIDAGGDAWATNFYAGLSEFSSTGAALSGSQGFTANSFSTPGPSDIAIDGAGNVWTDSQGGVTEFSQTGAVLSGPKGYNQGAGREPIALDPSGNLWVGYPPGISEVIGVAAPVVTPLAAAAHSSQLGSRP